MQLSSHPAVRRLFLNSHLAVFARLKPSAEAYSNFYLYDLFEFDTAQYGRNRPEFACA